MFHFCRSNLLGTDFSIYDCQPPHTNTKPYSCHAATRNISPPSTAGNFEIGQVTYKFNLLYWRRPRRMICSLQCPFPFDGDDIKMKQLEESSPLSPVHKVLKNKTPWWHEGIVSWCLNFHGRVTMGSAKNFQLVESGQGDEETVILQFGKVGDDVFTMDYRRPLSAFQAFAICLTSFGTKLS